MWKSIKWTMVTTYSNHSKVIALYEASRECVWLRPLVQHIRGLGGITTNYMSPIVIYEDNVACVTQMSNGYVKGNLTKHIECHAPNPGPTRLANPNRFQGAKPYAGTPYLFIYLFFKAELISMV